MNPPARVRVMLMGLSWSLHVTTVPFNMASRVAVTLRVDVRAEMRVAVKMPRSTGGCPTGVSLRNRTIGLNLVLLHTRLTPSSCHSTCQDHFLSRTYATLSTGGQCHNSVWISTQYHTGNVSHVCMCTWVCKWVEGGGKDNSGAYPTIFKYHCGLT